MDREKIKRHKKIILAGMIGGSILVNGGFSRLSISTLKIP